MTIIMGTPSILFLLPELGGRRWVMPMALASTPNTEASFDGYQITSGFVGLVAGGAAEQETCAPTTTVSMIAREKRFG